MNPVAYVPGGGVGIVCGDVVVLALDSAATQLRELAADVARGGDVAASVERAAGDIGADIGADIAVARAGAGRVELAAAGRATGEVRADELVVVDGGHAIVERAVEVVLRIDGTELERTPFVITDGVVAADALRCELTTGDAFDDVFGPTVVRTVESAAVREAAADRRQPVGVLVFSTGERVLVDRSIVVGRSPVAVPELAEARLLPVAGAAVSRQHAAVLVDRWRACVDDLGSSNGTTVTLPGSAPRTVRPGHPLGLVCGARVDLGGDVSFVVEEVA